MPGGIRPANTPIDRGICSGEANQNLFSGSSLSQGT